jgi:hypothetical protein
MSEPDGSGGIGPALVKQLGTVLSLATAGLSVTGFLAARSAVNSLGLPAHVEIPLDAYLQYGGRFVFAFLAHLLLIAAGLYGLIVLVRFARRYVPIPAPGPRIFAIGVVAAALAAILLELMLIDTPPSFGPRPPPAASAGEDREMALLLLIESLTVVAIALLLLRNRRASDAAAKADRAGSVLLWLLVGVQVMLIPICFGKVSVAPQTFPRVSLYAAGGVVEEGALVYRDDSDFYLWASGGLVQVARARVERVRYGAYEDVRTIRGR